jgi:3-deoxy-7-phosphoheptulonate synthase
MGAIDRRWEPVRGEGLALADAAAQRPAPVREPIPAEGCVPVGRHVFGRDFVLIAGPCAVESEPQLLETARCVHRAGAQMLRGGAFKPRTTPDSFQGLGERGLEILRRARSETGLPIVTEVMDARQLDLVLGCADVLQVGSRNMQNFTLLRELGHVDRPVLLKRGMSATLEEWIGAAEYVLSGGNRRVILCERGIRTFGSATRNTLDLAIVPLAKARSGLPVIVDPSHATGRVDLVLPMSLAAVAAGADGLLIEVHPNPASAL